MLKKLYPRFLKKLDHSLLTHYPVVWKSRIHVFGFFSLILGNIIAFLLGHLIPMSKTNVFTVSDYFSFQFVTTILLLFLGISYIFLQRRFPLTGVNTLKRVAIIPLYVLCFTSVIMNVSVFQNTVVTRIANIVPDDVFEKDADLSLQIKTYMKDVDNYSQSNLNVEKLKALGNDYGFKDLELDIDGHFEDYSQANKLQQIIASISSAKYYKKHYDLSGFLNSNNYEYGKTEYLLPLHSFPKARGNFWNVSIFMIGFFSLFTFLTTYFDGKEILGFLFGMFVFWFISIFGISFGGIRSLFGGAPIVIPILVLAAIPFLWRSKTLISKWVSGFVMILLYISGYSLYLIGYQNEFYSHSFIQIFVMEALFAALLVYILFLLKKELLPQRVK